MSDDFRDKFGSDDEFENFENSYDDYLNGTGMFGGSKYIKDIIELQKLIYQSFVVENKSYIKLPQAIVGHKNLQVYMFYFRNSKLAEFDQTINMIFN